MLNLDYVSQDPNSENEQMLDGSTNRRRQMNPFFVSKEKSLTSLKHNMLFIFVTYLQSFIRCVSAHCGQKSLTKAIYFQTLMSPLAFRTNQLDQSLFFLASNKLARARKPPGRLIKLTLLLERKLLPNQKTSPVKMKSFFPNIKNPT